MYNKSLKIISCERYIVRNISSGDKIDKNIYKYPNKVVNMISNLKTSNFL